MTGATETRSATGRTGLDIVVRGASVTGPAGPIVSGVDLRIGAGRTLAVVGESGSGKSLTAQALSGLLAPGLSASGSVSFGDTSVDLAAPESAWQPLRGSTVALLLQDPFTSLSPVHRCGAQIAETLRAHATGRNLTRRQLREAVAARLAEVNLPAHVARQYPSELSGGMRQRVAIACAIAADPLLLIADEPTTALDASTQGEVLELLARLQADRGMALLLISHDLNLVRGRADSVAVMYAGSIVEEGPAAPVLTAPAHPYTSALRASNLSLEVRSARLPTIAGTVPRPGEELAGCRFAPRCALATAECRAAPVPLAEIRPGWRLACIHSAAPLPVPPVPEVDEIAGETGKDPLLSVTGLTKAYGHRAAVEDASIVVGRGESVGIVGESGSGKTTLARCIAGLVEPDAGEIRFRGSLLSPGLRGRDPLLIQVVFQDPYSVLNPAMTVGQTLLEALAVARRPPGDLAALLADVGLTPDYRTKRPRDLSGGQRQRVAIARALALRPELLICDESVSALDVSVQAQVLNLLTDLRERYGLTILFISHDLAVVRHITDRVYVMNEGRIVESGAGRDVLVDPQHEYTRKLVTAART